jgi:hypothetical protein
MQPRLWVAVGDGGDNISQISLRVYPVELACFNDAVDGSSTCAARIGSGEQPVLFAQGHPANAALGVEIVDLRKRLTVTAGIGGGRDWL